MSNSTVVFTKEELGQYDLILDRALRHSGLGAFQAVNDTIQQFRITETSSNEFTVVFDRNSLGLFQSVVDLSVRNGGFDSLTGTLNIWNKLFNAQPEPEVTEYQEQDNTTVGQG